MKIIKDKIIKDEHQIVSSSRISSNLSPKAQATRFLRAKNTINELEEEDKAKKVVQ